MPFMCIEVMASWFTPIQDFIKHQIVLDELNEAKKIQKQAP